MKNLKTLLAQSILFAFSLVFFGNSACKAQQIVDDIQKKVVNNIGEQMKNNYVFPKVASQMADYLKSQLKNKAYAKVKSPAQFSNVLTRDLQKISKDKQ